MHVAVGGRGARPLIVPPALRTPGLHVADYGLTALRDCHVLMLHRHRL